MAKYEITAPDGNRYEITAPDNATEDQVLAYAQQNYQPAQETMATHDVGAVPKQPGKWSELPGNIPESAVRLAVNMAQPIIHPIQTGKGLGNLALGLAQKIIPGKQENEKYADALAHAISERYGSFPAVRETLITDPVGSLADVAGVVGGGAGLLRAGGTAAMKSLPRAAAVASKIGTVGGRVARTIDPTVLIAKAPGAILRGAVEPIVSNVVGTVTGGGASGLRELARAGREGGEAAQVARGNLRGTAPIEEIVGEAKAAVSAMRGERSANYTRQMAEIGKDLKPIKFDPIRKAVDDTKNIGVFKGKRIDKSTADVWDKIDEVVSDWEKSDPGEYHTPAGIDALKQAIGDIRDSSSPGTPSRVVADRVYHAVRGQITKQAPNYDKAMKGYEHASELIRDIESTLSVNPRANIDTTVRKLQSVMRNNVNTTYGRRLDLAKKLEEYGAKNLIPALAGQAYSSVQPRGLQALGATGAGVAALASNPAALPALAITSPRLMGEAAYYGGKASRFIPTMPAHQGVTQFMLQSGRNRSLADAILNQR